MTDRSVSCSPAVAGEELEGSGGGLNGVSGEGLEGCQGGGVRVLSGGLSDAAAAAGTWTSPASS